ncbi:MAG: AAA family ATPase, partial [Vicinamibacterales bacterium]
MSHVSTQSDSSRQRQSLLFGRQREQDLLRERLVAMLAGHGGLVLVGGEAGIGKTALVGWLAGEALARGARVLTGGCYDLTATPPYGPWLEAFEGDRLPGEIAQRPAADSMSSETALAYLAGIAGERPLVVVLEDLHWSDPASLDLLRHLARRVGALPVMLVATYRDDEIGHDHPLFPLLPLLVREAGAARVDPRRLDNASIQASVAGRYRLPASDERRLTAYLARLSDGNPLYLTELLRALEAERLLTQNGDGWSLAGLDEVIVPPLLRQIIAGRLARLR